ncbi:MAG TPA: sugar phosphate isomerase/epimerase family protein, partial [Phycisphaerales bacterium]|nr:sugar phosphate isomerase/epimerase family protein [Phycisphaerales bacterium]
MNTISRRDFVGRVGAIAAASFATAASARSAEQDVQSQPGANSDRIQKAVGLGMVEEPLSLADKFKLLRDLGFDGVEIDRPSDDDPDEILKAIEQSGLVVHGLVDSVHWHDHLNNPDPEVRKRGIKTLESCIHDAHTFKAQTVLLVPAVVNRDMNCEDAWRLSQQGIHEVLPLAQELGVIVAIENVWNQFIMSPLEARRYVDELNSPAAKWYFDIGNSINYGWPGQWIRTLGSRIARLHIKDFSRKKRDANGLW